MKDTTARLFERFVEKLPSDGKAVLYAAKVQPADATSAAPWHTVLIHGRYGGSDGPLAVVLMTLPSYSTDGAAFWTRTFP